MCEWPGATESGAGLADAGDPLRAGDVVDRAAASWAAGRVAAPDVEPVFEELDPGLDRRCGAWCPARGCWRTATGFGWWLRWWAVPVACGDDLAALAEGPPESTIWAAGEAFAGDLEFAEGVRVGCTGGHADAGVEPGTAVNVRSPWTGLPDGVEAWVGLRAPRAAGRAGGRGAVAAAGGGGGRPTRSLGAGERCGGGDDGDDRGARGLARGAGGAGARAAPG